MATASTVASFATSSGSVVVRAPGAILPARARRAGSVSHRSASLHSGNEAKLRTRLAPQSPVPTWASCTGFTLSVPPGEPARPQANGEGKAVTQIAHEFPANLYGLSV